MSLRPLQGEENQVGDRGLQGGENGVQHSTGGSLERASLAKYKFAWSFYPDNAAGCFDDSKDETLTCHNILSTHQEEARTENKERADMYIDWKLGEYTLAGLSPQRNLSIVFLSRERRHSPAQRWCNSPPALASLLFAIQISLQERQRP